ncbi:hypothetical protein [Spirochaeta cellobiosiphila]|uniref:hypothetical protein n=1 Tax=Spirochaeta cellobiosiphila TaxID=504483 RepID=UPI00041DA464|nr:hypothetical protein [Spirochaeta cellobiosiphila]
MNNKYIISKFIQKSDAYYELHWTALEEADKYKINAQVPAMSGIYELYYKDDEGKLQLLDVDMAYYGGLRNRIREIIDPELEIVDIERRKILSDYPLYFRFSLCDYLDDMKDTLSVYLEIRFPDWEGEEASGRYPNVFVKEISPDRIYDS